MHLKRDPRFVVHVCVTGQHRAMLDQVLEVFGMRPDVDLNLMEPDQSLPRFTGRCLEGVANYLRNEAPDVILLQGDTTTTLAAALAAFYLKIPAGHVEAGLRTRQKYSPFPEEINRALTAQIADYHFAPTARARTNLLQEGIREESIFVTGNTVVDALELMMEVLKDKSFVIPRIPLRAVPDEMESPLVLITGHRRENFGTGLEAICLAIKDLAKLFPHARFVYPVHLNPNVSVPVRNLLRDIRNVYLIEPLPYLSFVHLMASSTLILTDSGGIQEEAPSLKKPVLVLRESTERPEAIEAGFAKLVGTDRHTIVREAHRLLRDRSAREAMVNRQNPFGDGNASKRIVEILAGMGAGKSETTTLRRDHA